MDPHIFADPDPDTGSQNLADPTDPDPKHWFHDNRTGILPTCKVLREYLRGNRGQIQTT